MAFDLDIGEDNIVTIRVVGVGGAGNNVVNHMLESGTKGVEFIAVNTDKQALNRSSATQKVQIGEKLTSGRGAGSRPDVGRKSAEESRAQVAKCLEGADMVFITAGMGGGTGTGAAPVVAEVAREMEILTVGVVTKPFSYEGNRRMKQALEGIEEMRTRVDSLVIIPNDKLKEAVDPKASMMGAFRVADDVLQQAVESITDLIKTTGFINLDFADVSAIMKDAGRAHMGVGRAAGKGKAEEAARMAISSPLLETSINGATGVLVNVCGSLQVGMEEVETAANLVMEAAHPDANLIFGATFDESLDDEIRVTVIATGFAEKAETPAVPVAPVAPAVVAEAPVAPVAPAAAPATVFAPTPLTLGEEVAPTPYVPTAAPVAPVVAPVAVAPAGAPVAPVAPAADPIDEDDWDILSKIFGKKH